MFDPLKVKQFVQKQFDEKALPSLIQFIKIPNLSRTFDPEWQTNGKLLQAAKHINFWIQQIEIKGLKTQILYDEGYSPLIFTQIKGDIPITVFFYGHFDKQPPMSGWDQGFGPTIPVLKDGKLYGRGGADDGYSTYSAMLAIKALQQQNLQIPRCVMITQGDQQSCSGHMPHYLEILAQRIQIPQVCFCLDGGAFDYDRLWIDNSLRGNLMGTLSIQTLKNGVHSGDASGIVPSCFRIAKQIFARIQDPQTGQLIPDFHCDIPPQFYKENYQLSITKGQEAIKSYGLLTGCQQVSSNTLTSLLNRSWKPTLTITGQSGFPPAEGSGNVLHPKIQIRFSVRLPPTLDADKATKRLKQVIQKQPPYGAKIELNDIETGFGWTAFQYQTYLSKAIKESSEIYFQNQVLNCGDGGSIPLINTLSAMWPQAQIIITGVLGPNSNAHGPNQCLYLDFTKKLTCCMAYIMQKCCQNYKLNEK